MQRKRWSATIGRVGIVLALLGMLLSVFPNVFSHANAQDDGTDVATSVASPQASPVAAEESSIPRPVFLSGRWRISVVYANRTAAVPELDIAAKSDRNWVVTVVDVTNWSANKGTVNPKDFGIRFTGSEKASGFSASITEGAANALSLEPKVVEDGVGIGRGKSARLVLLFRIDPEAVDPVFVFEDAALPLAGAIARGGNLLGLPGQIESPKLKRYDVEEAIDAASLKLENGDFRLAGVDAPLESECFGSQAVRRLERLAGENVLLETGSDPGAAYLWVDDEDGLRKLVNYEVIAAGSAAFIEGTSGPYADWLAYADASAQKSVTGLWAACTNQHGVTRQQTPETTALKLESDGAVRGYAIWVAWAPLIITKPDGSAWVFFSAEPTAGDDKGNKGLYSSKYDPASGKWSDSTKIAGGDVQMGPTAVVDEDGIVHLVFGDRAKDEAGFFSEIMYTYEDVTGGWVTPVPVARQAGSGYQLSPSLTVDNLNVLHVSWQDQRAFSTQAIQESAANADIFASDLVIGESWTKPVLVNTHYTDAAASRPHIVSDGDRLVAVWSVYAASLGLNAAARVEWSSRPLDDPLGWTTPEVLIVGRGEGFGGRLLDMVADPTGGVLIAYGRQATDTFLFLRRLPADATEWGGDTLLTFGNRGTFPSITVNDQGVVYVVYNVGTGTTVDVGAVAIPFRSIQPGPEVILTEDQPNTQGRPIVTTDLSGRPWIIYFNEPPGGVANEVRVLRNAEIPSTVE